MRYDVKADAQVAIEDSGLKGKEGTLSCPRSNGYKSIPLFFRPSSGFPARVLVAYQAGPATVAAGRSHE